MIKRLVVMGAICLSYMNLNAQVLQPQTGEERKAMIEERRQSQDDLTQQAKKREKMVKKTAKELKKQGWKVSPGVDDVETQLTKYYSCKYEMVGNFPKYIIGEATGRGANLTAARKQAIALAKLDVCSQMEAEVAELTEVSVSNKEINRNEAESLTSTLSSSKMMVQQKLGHTPIMLDVYREKDGLVEVRMLISYDGNQAKADMIKAFENASKEQQERLMRILSM